MIAASCAAHSQNGLSVDPANRKVFGYGIQPRRRPPSPSYPCRAHIRSLIDLSLPQCSRGDAVLLKLGVLSGLEHGVVYLVTWNFSSLSFGPSPVRMTRDASWSLSVGRGPVRREISRRHGSPTKCRAGPSELTCAKRRCSCWPQVNKQIPDLPQLS